MRAVVRSAVAPKSVESSSVSQKARPKLIFEDCNVEKLRKPLEKKAADFQREKQKTAEVVNKF